MWQRLASVARMGLRAMPIAISAAVVVGMLEGFFLLGLRFYRDQLTFVGTEILWMAPVGYLALFVAALLAALLLSLLVPRIPADRVFLLAVGCLGVIGLSRTVPLLRLYPAAVLVLAAGIGYQLSRVGVRWLGSRTALRTSMLATVAVLAAVARSRQSEDRGAGAPELAGRPNVLLLVWDTVRDLNVSLYGYSRPTTPFLERWAQRGVVFERAIATSSWTLPSHASLFTGRLPHELSADFQRPLDATFPTLAEVLGTQGYQTAGFVANPYYTTAETGLSRGFDRWRDYRWSVHEVLLSAGAIQWLWNWRAPSILRHHDIKRAPEITDQFLGWLDGRDGRRPFFAFLNYFDAHKPRYAPPGIVQQFADSSRPTVQYDAAIAFLDQELERLLAALETRGVLGHTIVVITSDHGEQFGKHGLFEHANSLYRQVIQVPLVLIAPGRVPAGIRVEVPVSLRNVPATILDLAGVSENPLPGVSHTRFWRDSADVAQDDPVLSELTPAPRAAQQHRNARGEIRSLVDGDYHFIQGVGGVDELFDLRADPSEANDLKGREHLPSRALMWQQLRAYNVGFPRKLAGISTER
jgi:arylsulfatase A-like enzyme